MTLTISAHNQNCPLISLPLSQSVQKEKCFIGSQISNGDEYEEVLSDAINPLSCLIQIPLCLKQIPYPHPASTPPTELPQTPMRHDFPRSSPVISEFGKDFVDTVSLPCQIIPTLIVETQNFMEIDTRDSPLAQVPHSRSNLPLHLTRTLKEKYPTLTLTKHCVTNSRASMKSSIIVDGKVRLHFPSHPYISHKHKTPVTGRCLA